MKKASSNRRIPRKIGDDEDGSEEPEAGDSGSAIKRPTSKPRKSSSLRSSLGPPEPDDDAGSVVTPKRSNLSRIAIQRNASQRSSLLSSQISSREVQNDDERPTYSAASLQELKDSTPSTPRDLTGPASDPDADALATGTQALELAAKFGSSLAYYQQPSAIPSAAEIAEKKARRARLAKEQQAEEYISLNPSDAGDDEDENVTTDASGRLILKPKDQLQADASRLVRDDEDLLEHFDEFTEDGGISLGRKAEAAAARRRRDEMAAQIAAAEGSSSDDDDSDEGERNAAFAAVQAKHGTYNENQTGKKKTDLRPRTPPIITPLPTLEGAIERLRRQLAEMQTSQAMKQQELEALRKQKVHLAEEEVRIQRALKDTAEKFEQLRREKGIGAAKVEDNAVPDASGPDHDDRPRAQSAEMKDESEDSDDDFTGPAGLGFGAGRAGAGTYGLGMQTTGDSDDGMM